MSAGPVTVGGTPTAGVLVVDKPGGMTSHDVVAKLRRLLGTRRVGHAGTLDPMATGVLVALVGEATKLGSHLTLHDKRYLARVAFGRATDTLDAEGATTTTEAVPAWLLDELRGGEPGGRLAQALELERARTEQVPPAFSAIQVDGRRSYDRARAGEEVSLPPRPVAVHALRLVASAVAGGGEPWADLDLHVGKGYYVRSFARDLGERLGVPAHLAALRRTASGPFALAEAVRLDAGPGPLLDALIPIATAVARALPVGALTPEGTLRARRGQRLSPGDFASLPPAGEGAWLDPDGRLVALGLTEPSGSATNPDEVPRFAILRGFVE
jgi:tRNA pseudouridine55 synthase